MTVVASDHLMPVYRRWPIDLVRGSGAIVFDSEGRRYVDLVAGIAVAGVGHAHPRVAAAVAEQAARLIHVSNLYGTVPQRDLSARLAGLTGGMATFFCNSGAEAVECAIKLARKWGGPGRRRIVAARGGFHGRTMGALAATGQPAKQAPFTPLPEGFTHVEYGSADALDRALGADVCAVILEPIQGEAGIVVPPDGYLRDARALCERAGVLLVFDEVQTGLGRTGRWFAYQHEDLVPDVLCLGKALGGGLPIAACLARPEVADAFEAGDHGSTFGGGPVQSAAALATLEVIDAEGLVRRAELLGARLRARLEPVLGSARVRGRGLLLGLDVGSGRARAVAEAALARGVLVNDVNADTLRICPPMVIDEADLEEAVEVLEEVAT